MRAILVDWLVEVHESFKMNEQTLGLTVRYLEEVLAKEQVTKHELQLLGITCLWMASKFEEIYPPRLKHFVDVAANTYSMEDMLRMELRVLECLKYQLIKTTSYQVLEFILKREITYKFGCLCRYLSEMANSEGLTRKYRPSVIAISAVTLADSIFKTEHSEHKYENLFKISPQEKVNCFKDLASVLANHNKFTLRAIKKKYASEKYYGVSKTQLEAA